MSTCKSATSKEQISFWEQKNTSFHLLMFPSLLEEISWCNTQHVSICALHLLPVLFAFMLLSILPSSSVTCWKGTADTGSLMPSMPFSVGLQKAFARTFIFLLLSYSRQALPSGKAYRFQLCMRLGG